MECYNVSTDGIIQVHRVLTKCFDRIHKLTGYCVRTQTICRAPDKLRICVFYAMKTNKNACIIRSECTHYAYILLCKQTFQIRSVLVVVYKAIHFCLWEIPRNYFPLYFSKERAYTSEGYRMLAFLSINVNITNKCGAPFKEWFTW